MNIDNKVVPYCVCAVINDKKIFSYYEKNVDIIMDILKKIVCEKQKKVELFCHNINFDGVLIIESLMKNNIFFSWFIRDLNIYWIEIVFINVKIKIRCSYKIIPLSLKYLGSLINKNKGVFPYKFSSLETLEYIGSVPNAEYFESITDWDLCKKESDVFDFKQKTLDYCFNDIYIIMEVLKNIEFIIKEYSKTMFRSSYSFSSLSYKMFSDLYDVYKITDVKISSDENKYFRKAYYGGRCEVFGNPDENEIVHHFDFSGMYGQCMMEKFPIKSLGFKKKDLDYNRIGFHNVKVWSNMNIPVLPIHHKNKLFFPNGCFVGVYWYEEIQLFIENGGKVIDHYNSYEYSEESHVFKEFVNEFKNIRNKGLYYNIFGKSMINGLYGSFALDDDDDITIISYSEEELNALKDLVNVIKWEKIGMCIVINIKKDFLSKKFYGIKNELTKDIKKRNVAYAAIISSKARIKLYKAFKEVIKNDGKLFYSDTDSVFAGFKCSMLNKEMGEIKWSDVYSDAVFISPKFYYLKESYFKAKGVNYKQNYDFKTVKNDFYSNTKNLIFNNQLQFKKKNFSLVQNYLSKKLSINSYNKRIFDKTRKKTVPIIINPD